MPISAVESKYNSQMQKKKMCVTLQSSDSAERYF